MDPIVNEFVTSKPRRDSTKKNHSSRSPENPPRNSYHDNDRNPRPGRENRARIPMMHLMQPAHERSTRMPQHAMDHVLEQRPHKNSGRKDKSIGEHDDPIVSR